MVDESVGEQDPSIAASDSHPVGRPAARGAARSRAVYIAAWSVVGYMFGVMLAAVAMSVVYANRVNSVTTRVTRDRWSFILGLAGLVIAGFIASRRSDLPPDAPARDER